MDLPRPTNVKEVQDFMGNYGYYCRFIYMYDMITKPIYGLITTFDWTDECEQSFEKLKTALISAPILRSLIYSKTFHVHVDASTYVVGCILAQPGDNHMDFPILYASRQLNNTERNYSTTKQEGLGMIFVIKKYRHYLLANKFIFFIYHQALLKLVNKPCNTGRIVRWFLILLEFDFIVVVKQGKTHQRANHLIQMIHVEKPTGIDDDLLHAYLMPTFSN